VNFDDLLRQKNYTIQALDLANKSKSLDKKALEALAAEAAVLEDKIAEIHAGDGHNEDAAANFVSAGSCWKMAGQFESSKKSFDRALELTKKPALIRWINNYKKSIP
jgi:hypothetical protein